MLGRPLRVQGMYTATEGSFAAELDPEAPGELHLMTDMAVFTFRDVETPDAPLVPAWQVARGHRYEVFLTTLGGLVQYQIGDVLEITATRPLRVRVAGRTAEELNIATEKLSLKQAHAALDAVAAHAPLHRDRFMVLVDPTHSRRHLWVVEALDAVDEARAAHLIDAALASINPSYAALRNGDALLDAPRVVVCERGSFDAYMAAGFATRGQFKFRHFFPDASALAQTAGLEAVAARIGTA
jgi:hypothetical protein